MGNQSSSCHAASSCTVSSSLLSSSLASYTSSINNSSVIQPCAAAKVLLLDGTVLHFTHKVRAIQVLLNHPNHCLCPAQSLHPLNHSNNATSSSSTNDSTTTTLLRPISLLPDDHLQPGHIYILLPLHIFHRFAAAAAAAHNNGAKTTAAKRKPLPLSRASNSAQTSDLPSQHTSALSSSANYHPRRRSFELQRPHHRRSVSMRRCRSWRPRLQAINEIHD